MTRPTGPTEAQQQAVEDAANAFTMAVIAAAEPAIRADERSVFAEGEWMTESRARDRRAVAEEIAAAIEALIAPIDPYDGRPWISAYQQAANLARRIGES